MFVTEGKAEGNIVGFSADDREGEYVRARMHVLLSKIVVVMLRSLVLKHDPILSGNAEEIFPLQRAPSYSMAVELSAIRDIRLHNIK